METTDPQTMGFDPGRLARIDRFIAEHYLAPGLLPHAQLLVARDGVPVHFSTQGRARAASDAPLRSDSIFRIASMTKPVTSVAFMMLVEEGRTALDQPVADVIPEFADLAVFAGGGGKTPFRTVPPERQMLMLDLLRHSSGLTYDFQNVTPVDAAYRAQRLGTMRPVMTLDAFAARLGTIPLEFSPGTAWNYSVSTDILGLVVERVAGERFDHLLKRRIFAPLGMTDSDFDVPPEKIDRLTDAWAIDPKRGRIVYDTAQGGSWWKPPLLAGGGGGLVSTTADYHRFCRMLLGGGTLDGVRILGRKTIALMTANHLPGGADLQSLSRSMFSEAIYAGQGFGLGFAVNLDPVKAMVPGSAGEYYWGGIFSTYFFIDPVERLSMIFMTQLMPSTSTAIRRQLKTMVYSALT